MNLKKHNECLKLYNQGLSDHKIAQHVGFHHSTISRWREKNKLKPNFSFPWRLSIEEHEKRLKLYNGGLSDREIGDAVNVSGAAIFQWRQRHELEDNRQLPFIYRGGHRIHPIQQKIIRTYHKNKDLSWGEITRICLGEAGLHREDYIKTVIGNHLMRVCRSQEKCAYKALLPEYDIQSSV